MTDMTNITGMYSDAYANAANQSASKLKDKLNGTDYSQATDDELLDACKQFEAYFVEQLYKGMMKTIPQNEDTSNYTSTITDFYKDQMLQSIAEQTTEQSGLGLAQMLYEQMKRNYGLDTVPEEAAETAAAANASETAEV
ncbi:MAG: rod-binding protein [Firmicutes bacterium]|nr:rod-binding protein [Bacillota bacterium]